MVVPAESQGRDATEEHLHPSHSWHKLSHDSVSNHSYLSNLTMEAFRNVELQVDAEDDLNNQHQHQPIREASMGILRECSPLMQMSEEVCRHRNRRSHNLYRYMPSISNYLWYELVEVVSCGKNSPQVPFQSGK